MQAGGFDEDVVFYEEATLPYKIEAMSYNVRVRIRSPILHYEEDFSLARWPTKKYYYARTARKYRLRYHNYAVKQMSLAYRLTLFLRDRRFYTNPLLAAGALALKSLEYIFAGIGYLVNAKKQ